MKGLKNMLFGSTIIVTEAIILLGLTIEKVDIALPVATLVIVGFTFGFINLIYGFFRND